MIVFDLKDLISLHKTHFCPIGRRNSKKNLKIKKCVVKCSLDFQLSGEKINLKQGRLLSFRSKIQTLKIFKRTLFIRGKKQNMRKRHLNNSYTVKNG